MPFKSNSRTVYETGGKRLKYFIEGGKLLKWLQTGGYTQRAGVRAEATAPQRGSARVQKPGSHTCPQLSSSRATLHSKDSETT